MQVGCMEMKLMHVNVVDAYQDVAVDMFTRWQMVAIPLVKKRVIEEEKQKQQEQEQLTSTQQTNAD
jgi:hypothetical protein